MNISIKNLSSFAKSNRRVLNSLLLAAATSIISINVFAVKVNIPVMDDAVFYDGYQTNIIYDKDLDDGILRHDNSLYAVKLQPSDIDRIGDNLHLTLTLKARCDNYDRYGNVRLVLVPKGATSYDPQSDEIQRVELARFITPFMNKNKTPASLNYEWEIPEAAYILRDPTLGLQYDFWIEAFLFGIPYAANTQVRGCADRNDVFAVSIAMTADEDSDSKIAAAAASHILVPIYTSRSEIHGNVNFNSYTEGACDRLGVAAKTYAVEIADDLNDCAINLIMTNHGANSGGEEYIRRLHNVYFDDNLVFSYIPGGVSCEPYRKYNTQLNGIYSSRPRNDWEEWSNWCPGEAVPTRRISLGHVAAGHHEIRIAVPDAEFVDNQGDFRPSLYLQGLKEGQLPLSGVDIVYDDILSDSRIHLDGSQLNFCAETPISEVRLYDIDGTLLEGRYTHNAVSGSIDLDGRKHGAYLLMIIATDNRYVIHKVLY